MTHRVQTGRAVATVPDRDPRYGWMPASVVDPKGCPGGKRRALAYGTERRNRLNRSLENCPTNTCPTRP